MGFTGPSLSRGHRAQQRIPFRSTPFYKVEGIFINLRNGIKKKARSRKASGPTVRRLRSALLRGFDYSAVSCTYRFFIWATGVKLECF